MEHKHLWLFNPGYEATLRLPESSAYTPAKRLQTMSRDLSPLCCYLARTGDYIWSPYATPKKQLLPASTSAAEVPTHLKPWGLAPASRHHWLHLAREQGLTIVLPEVSKNYCTMSDRSYSAKILEALCHDLNLDKSIVPNWLSADGKWQEIISSSDENLLAKLPYTSSGRGLIFLPKSLAAQERVSILAKRLHPGLHFSVETCLDRESDWAMEFESDGAGNIHLKGYSHFFTSSAGAYLGNHIAPQSVLRQAFSRRLANSGIPIERVEEALCSHLRGAYAHTYAGAIGVDMLFYRTASGELRLHPMVEVNLRYTMGFVAMGLERHLVATGSSGRFIVCSAGRPEVLAAKIKATTATAGTPIFDGQGHCRQGYFPLTEIFPDSLFHAFLLLERKT